MELDADGGLGVHVELVAGVAGEEVGLADGGVADYDDLEEVLIASLVLRRRHSCQIRSDLIFGRKIGIE